jgi:hypothetical protein
MVSNLILDENLIADHIAKDEIDYRNSLYS